MAQLFDYKRVTPARSGANGGLEILHVTVNGQTHETGVAGATKLLYFLRNDLQLNGPKFGCGLGECGACAVLVDGRAARACTVTLGRAAGREIVTLEGLGTSAAPHPVQAAFIAEQAAQCGYCLNGMIVAAAALLARVPQPSETQIKSALRHHLCRCGAHLEIIRAVQRAAGRLA